MLRALIFKFMLFGCLAAALIKHDYLLVFVSKCGIEMSLLRDEKVRFRSVRSVVARNLGDITKSKFNH